MKEIGSLFWAIIFLLGIHIAVMFSILPDKNLPLVLEIHGFLALTAVISFFILKKVKAIDKTKVGMAFLSISVGKMLLSLIFLLLLFYLTDITKMVLVGNFFVAYFAYLIIDVSKALKEVNKL